MTTEEGTGLVHLAPAFGEVDRQIGRENGLPSLNPVGPDGRFTDATGGWPGATCARPTTTSTTAWRRRGCCVRRHPYVHSYPHCWRCRTPLIYWGKPSWYIATSSRKDDLLAANETVDWHPEHIQDGRFGEWLANNVDWALSPRPVLGHAAADLAVRARPHALRRLAGRALRAVGRDVTGIDPHRPTIDDVTFTCSTVPPRPRRARGPTSTATSWPCPGGWSR